MAMTSNAGEAALDVHVKNSSVPVQSTSPMKSATSSSQVKPLANENDPSNCSMEKSENSVSENDTHNLSHDSCPTTNKDNKVCEEEGGGVTNTRDVISDQLYKCEPESVSKRSSDVLSEEVVGVLNNSKNATVSKNSELEPHPGPLNDSQKLQEELDSLEQLAMESAQKIESELESKEMDLTKLECSLPKESIVTDNEVHPVSDSANSCRNSELLNSSAAGNLKEELLVNVKTLVKQESSVTNLPVTECAGFNKETSLKNDESSNSGKIYQSLCDTASFIGNDSCSSDTLTCTLTSKISNIIQCSEDENLENFNEKEITVTSKVSKVSKDEKSLNFPSESLTSKSSSLSNEEGCDIQTSAIACPLSSEGKTFSNPSYDEHKDSRAHNDELKNYETDEDDLKVLEEFIVKSATNPEIAVCSTNRIPGDAAKYSLESSLLDDLTTNDNEIGPNIEVLESERESTTLVNKESMSENATPNQEISSSVTTQVNSGHEQEKGISAVSDNRSMDASKCKPNSNIRRQIKQKTGRCIGKFLPLKKRLSPRKLTNGDDCVGVKSEEQASLLSGVNSSVKRSKGRSLGNCKKTKYDKDTEKETHFNTHKHARNENKREGLAMVPDKQKSTISHSSLDMHAKDKFLNQQPGIQSVKNAKKCMSFKSDLHNKSKARFSNIPSDDEVGEERQRDLLLNCSSPLVRKTRVQKCYGEYPGLTSRTLRQERGHPHSSVPSRYLYRNKYLSTIPKTTRNKKAKKSSENMKVLSHSQNTIELKKHFNANYLEYLSPVINLSVSWCTELTYDLLKSRAKDIVLPSSLWSVVVDEDENSVIFLRTVDALTESYGVHDKAMIFQRSLIPITFIFSDVIYLPIPSLETFEDVILLILNFDLLSLCEGTGIKQRPRSKYCYRYKDASSTDFRCSQCLEERRRVLSCYIRKLKDKIRLAEKS